MTDLHTIIQQQTRTNMQTRLNEAVTNGDQEAAQKIANELAQFEVKSAPKAPPYGQDEIRAELDKLEWFGVDPKKSQRAIELGRNLNLKKFATAEAFAKAIIDAVEAEFKPAKADDVEPDDQEDEELEDKEEKIKTVKKRRSDGPGENDSAGRPARRASGPWTKISDAPPEIQKDIKRQADKFVKPTAAKEVRDRYIADALGVHYAIHQRKK